MVRGIEVVVVVIGRHDAGTRLEGGRRGALGSGLGLGARCSKDGQLGRGAVGQNG